MRKLLVLVAIVVAAVGLYFRDGPPGPPLFTDTRYGAFRIDGVIWLADDETALRHGSKMCLEGV